MQGLVCSFDLLSLAVATRRQQLHDGILIGSYGNNKHHSQIFGAMVTPSLCITFRPHTPLTQSLHGLVEGLCILVGVEVSTGSHTASTSLSENRHIGGLWVM